MRLHAYGSMAPPVTSEPVVIGGELCGRDGLWLCGPHSKSSALPLQHFSFLMRGPMEYEQQCWSLALPKGRKDPPDVSFHSGELIDWYEIEKGGIKSLIRALERWFSWPCSYYCNLNNLRYSTNNKLTARRGGEITSASVNSADIYFMFAGSKNMIGLIFDF